MMDPSLPCPFWPGSPEKTECLAMRVELGLSLWVEGDSPGGPNECEFTRKMWNAISTASLQPERAITIGDTFAVGKRRRQKPLVGDGGSYTR